MNTQQYYDETLHQARKLIKEIEGSASGLSNKNKTEWLLEVKRELNKALDSTESQSKYTDDHF